MSLLDTVGSTFAKLAGKGLAASAVLSRSTPGLLDAATGAPTTATVTTTTALALLDGSSLKTLGFKFGDGLAQGGDIMASIAALGLAFTPQPGDTLTVGGVVYGVVEVRPTYAGAVPVLFEMLVRL